MFLRHSFFKSKDKRDVFPPRGGPAPGEYEPKLNEKKKAITSSFKCVCDRFNQTKNVKFMFKFSIVKFLNRVIQFLN
jgi:hypothetical protein